MSRYIYLHITVNIRMSILYFCIRKCGKNNGGLCKLNNIKKIYAISLFFILGIFMISSPSLRIYAADEQGSSSNDGGSKGDSGGGNKDDGGGKEDSKESNDGGGNEKSNSQSKDVEDSGTQQEDKQETGAQETKNPDDLKGTPEEQEKAAVEDYINEEPGIKKPYPPVTDKPKWGTGTGIHTNPWKGEGGNWCKQHPDKCDHPIQPIHDGCDHGNWHHGCDGGKGGHGGSGHGGHNDWCSHHDCHHHHHSNTHFTIIINGDVTVKGSCH